MVFIVKNKNQYIGFDGDGGKTMYEITCSTEEEFPNYEYYNEKYFKEMGCRKPLNPNYE